MAQVKWFGDKVIEARLTCAVGGIVDIFDKGC